MNWGEKTNATGAMAVKAPTLQQLIEAQSELDSEIQRLHSRVQILTGSFALPSQQSASPLPPEGYGQLQVAVDRTRDMLNDVREIINALVVAV